ncbi:MAG: hypothetical protein AAF862_13525 [Pseudomonadota bacterium]
MKAIMLFVPLGAILGYILADVSKPLSPDTPMGVVVASNGLIQS